MLEQAGIIDFNGHASVRLPGTDRLLINAAASVRSRATADDIVTIDLEGNLVEGAGGPPMEFPLHTEIYRRRPDVGAVIHAHPTWSTVLTTAQVTLKPVLPQAALLGQVPVYPSSLSINRPHLGAAVADTLGSRRAVLLRSHGAVTVGADLTEAFALSVYLEENARRQYLASQLGEPQAIEPEELATLAEGLRKPHLLTKVWDYYRSKVSRLD